MTFTDGPPRFDHRDTGTPAAAWRALRDDLPDGAAVGPHDHLLVLAAHPDDETLGAGGLLADAARAGAQTTVVVASDGEASHPDSPTRTPQQLAAVRVREITAAVGRLAPEASLVLLHRPDGRLADDVPGLVDALDDAAAGATVVACPWREDGHPDHEACGDAAAAVAERTGARLLEYPVWGWHWGEPGRTGPLRGDHWVARRLSAAAREAKAAALAEHRSQHAPLSDRAGDEAVVGPGLVEHCTAEHEVFRESAPADLPARYFDRLYAGADDPWGIDRGFYEERKRRLLLAALPRRRFRSAFEPGCARGTTTVELAARCERVLACDASAAAVDAARQRTTDLRHVEVRQGAVPGDWPDGRFDLVVVSEVGYYLAEPTVLAARAHEALTDDGVLVACHWRHPAPGYPSSAEQVHDALGRGLHRVAQHVEPDFLLDVWTRGEASVARAEGLLG